MVQYGSDKRDLLTSIQSELQRNHPAQWEQITSDKQTEALFIAIVQSILKVTEENNMRIARQVLQEARIGKGVS